jgi:rhs family protein-like protein
LGSFNPPIDLNSAANGVFLPSRPGSTAPGAYHPSLHSDDYYDALRDDFRNVGTRDEAIEALDRIRDQLLDATYPGSKPVPPKE